CRGRRASLRRVRGLLHGRPFRRNASFVGRARHRGRSHRRSGRCLARPGRRQSRGQWIARGPRRPGFVRRLLLHSYYFPPIGGAGAQRPAKFAQHLPQYGYEPIVLTGMGASAGRWTPLDPSLSAALPENLEVLRVRSPEPNATAWRIRAARWLRIQHEWARWWIEGTTELAERAEPVDAIWTVMSPYPSAPASAEIARRLGCPWIPDLGDPWALDEMMVYPSALHRRAELRRMRHSLSTAAAIVMSTPEAVKQVKRYFPELADRPIIAIPNGFDA